MQNFNELMLHKYLCMFRYMNFYIFRYNLMYRQPHSHHNILLYMHLRMFDQNTPHIAVDSYFRNFPELSCLHLLLMMNLHYLKKTQRRSLRMSHNMYPHTNRNMNRVIWVHRLRMR